MKKTLRYLPSLWIVEDGIHNRIIYGKDKPKLIADYRGAGLFVTSQKFHLLIVFLVCADNCSPLAKFRVCR